MMEFEVRQKKEECYHKDFSMCCYHGVKFYN